MGFGEKLRRRFEESMLPPAPKIGRPTREQQEEARRFQEELDRNRAEEQSANQASNTEMTAPGRPNFSVIQLGQSAVGGLRAGWQWADGLKGAPYGGQNALQIQRDLQKPDRSQ